MSVKGQLSAIIRYVLIIALIALTYYISAKLARFLAIPPGFATAIWPSAGVALAALIYFGPHHWPGIFIGSFILNLGSPSAEIPLHIAIAKAATLAASPAIQGLLGSMLICRDRNFSNALEQPRDIVSVFVYGGGIACIAGAVISTFTLYISGSLPGHYFISNMMTWWIGDLLGVAIFAPFLLVLSAPAHMASFSRKGMMSFVLITVFMLSAYVFFTARDYYRQVQYANFEKTANEIKTNLIYTFETYMDVLAYTKGLFTASDEVTQDDFNNFTNIIMQRRPEIGAIMWLPYVTHKDRAAFEAYQTQANGKPFQIIDYINTGIFRPATARDYYFPITYISPEYFRAVTLGTDTYNTHIKDGISRRDTINLAWKTGQSLISPVVTVLALNGVAGIAMCNPVYHPDDLARPVEERRLLGMIAALLPVSTIMNTWTLQLHSNQLELSVVDKTEPDKTTVIHDTAITQSNPDAAPLVRSLTPFLKRETVAVGGRYWELTFSENNMRKTAPENWILWVILVGGMSFTAMLSAFLLLVSGRTQVVQRLVTQKTQEVAAGRDNLERANVELKRQYDIVKEKEETFRMAMEHASIGMALVTPEGKFRNVNHALSNILGYSDEELLRIDFQSITHPDDLQSDMNNVNRLLNGEAQTYRMQKRYYHKKGHLVWVLLSVSLVRDVKGKPLYFISQIHDITELKEVELERQQLVDQLIESNTDLEKFAYVASHDMQEPLRMMASFSELLIQEQGTKLDDEGRQYLKLITDSAHRMQTMVSDLLEYARINRQNDHIEMVDAEVELAHVKENLAAAITRSRGIITHDQLPRIKGNPVQFASLLQNIISNALKYQRSDTQPKVHVSAVAKDNFWEFTITDNGIGMASEDLNKIFEPFTRLNPWQQYQGTGLGLAICQKIVESQGGRIWAHSKPGEGSSFHFTFPRDQ